MKKLRRRLFLGGLLLVASILIVVGLLPRTFVVERSVDIDRPRAEVFDYLRNLRNQPDFSSWARIDPNMKTRFRGTDGEVESVYAWDSAHPDVGTGEMEITRMDTNDRLEMEIRFEKPFRSRNPASVVFEPLGENRTRVVQTYHGTMPYPMNAMCCLVAAIIGEGVEETLRNLKAAVESAPGDQP